MIRATSDFPKDKYYQMGLARAKAWGGFARDTTRTATAERFAFRDHFLPSAIIGAEGGAFLGAFASIPVGVIAGAKLGAEVGLLAGAGTAVGGALLGAGIGGLSTLLVRLQDRIIGPPVAYYELFGGLSHSSSSSTSHMSSDGGGTHHTGGAGGGAMMS